jgi:hypothetical protein
MPISTLLVTHAASLWYPIMLTQERGEISEAKAAELLGLAVEDYREKRERAIGIVMQLVNTLPSGLNSLLDVMKDKPEFFGQKFSALNSGGKADPSDCT